MPKVTATDRSTVDPADVGVDPSALDALRSRITVEQDAGRMPAAQFALAVDGRIALFESFGSATNSTRFAVFSCTKALIAGVVWQLIGEGELSADMRAIDLIPGFGTTGRTPEWMAEVTLEQLLIHTSGFPTAPLGPPTWATRDGRLDAFSRWHTSFDPGTHFEYHPTAAHWVVAEMIEAVEGKDYRTSVRERIFEPLGLSGLEFGPAADRQDDIAELTMVGEPPTPAEIESVFGAGGFDLGEVTPELLLTFNDPAVRSVGVPGAGAVSTAADLALYYQALLRNPGGLWDPAVLADGTGHIRCALPNPDLGFPANRSLGLIIAGDDGLSKFRGMGATVSPRAFGHNGAGGQIAWADPTTGASFVFVTSGLDVNFIREARRIVSLASKGGLLVPHAA